MSITTKAIGLQQGLLANIGLSTGEPIIPDRQVVYMERNEDGTYSYTTKLKSPLFQDGNLYFGLRPDAESINMLINEKEVSIGKHRAYIYLDHEDDNGAQNRYVVASPFDATLHFPNPETSKRLEIINLQNIPLTALDLPFLWSDKSDTKKYDLTLLDGVLNFKTSNCNASSIIRQSVNSTGNTIEYLGISGGGDSTKELRIDPAGNVSLKGDKTTLSYNDITQSLDFIFN